MLYIYIYIYNICIYILNIIRSKYKLFEEKALVGN